MEEIGAFRVFMRTRLNIKPYLKSNVILHNCLFIESRFLLQRRSHTQTLEHTHKHHNTHTRQGSFSKMNKIVDWFQDKFGFASKGSETGSGEALATFIIEENLKSLRKLI